MQKKKAQKHTLDLGYKDNKFISKQHLFNIVDNYNET